MDRWSDEEILAGVRDAASRARAFRALHLRYGPRLLGLLTRMCHGDRDRAEDLLGRALYKAYQGLAVKGLEQPCRSLSSWLYTVTARVALDELEREKRGDPPQWATLNEDLAHSATPTFPVSCSSDETAAARCLSAAVEEVLERLAEDHPRYRTLLEMEYVGVCDRSEISEATGIDRKQITQYLKRARQRFLQLALEQPALAAWAAAKEGCSSPVEDAGCENE